MIIEVELTSGRYHAHVWGEAQFGMGEPEWPPSPWRLLRAIASAWFSITRPPCTADERDRLLEALGRACPPMYLVPRVAFQELRYFQPIPGTRVAHHDHFAILQGGRVFFVFNAELSEPQRTALDALLARLRYFGRAESRAIFRRLNTLPACDGLYLAQPVADSAPSDRSVVRRVLCSSAAHGFQASNLWSPRPPSDLNIGELSSARMNTLKEWCKERNLSPTGKRNALVERLRDYQQRRTAPEGSPVHLVDALLSQKKPLPDGCLWVEYVLPRESIVWELPATQASLSPAQASSVPVRSIRFRLCRRVPLPLIDTVAVARAFRDAAVREFHRRTNGGHSTTLTGKHANGDVCRGHRHTYYLPRRSGASPHLDELIVVIPVGALEPEELEALLSVGRVHLRPSDPYPVAVVHEAIQHNDQVPVRSLRWRAVTPFLSPRRGRRGRPAAAPEEQLIESVKRVHGHHLPAAVIPRGRAPVRCHEYEAEAGRWHLTQRVGFWFELRFEEPVDLRLPVGLDAHFGLGQFEPVT